MTMPNMTEGPMRTEMMQVRCDTPVFFYAGYKRKISDEKMVDMGIKIKNFFLGQLPYERAIGQGI